MGDLDGKEGIGEVVPSDIVTYIRIQHLDNCKVWSVGTHYGDEY